MKIRRTNLFEKVYQFTKMNIQNQYNILNCFTGTNAFNNK